MQKYLPRIHVCTTESFPRHQYDLCILFDQCLPENKCTLYKSQQILYIPWVKGKWNLCLKLILTYFFQKTHTRGNNNNKTGTECWEDEVSGPCLPWRLVDNAATFFFWNLPLILLITYPSFLWVCFKVFPLNSDKYSH